MTCDEARIGLHALLDGELDVAKNVEVLAHLEACAPCRRECERDDRLKLLVQEDARALAAAPSDLWPAITAAIEREASTGQGVVRGHARGGLIGFGRRQWRPRVAWAAAALVVVLLSLAYVRSASRPPFVAEEIVMDHLGSILRAQGPVDVASGDPAVVLDRLGRGVSFAVRVPNLAVAEARLLGGSVCQLRSTRGVRLTYALGKDRTVSFYQLERTASTSFPAPGAKPIYVGYVDPQRGPGAVLWANEQFLFALVAELSPEHLEDLAARL